jgi:hypothetical protein
MNLVLAVLWTFALITDIISCAMGNDPSWILVLCPLGILVLDYWEKVIDEYYG